MENCKHCDKKMNKINKQQKCKYVFIGICSVFYLRQVHVRCTLHRVQEHTDNRQSWRKSCSIRRPFPSHNTSHISLLCLHVAVPSPCRHGPTQRTHTKRVFVCICKSCLQNLSGSLSSVGSMCLWCSWLSHAGMPLGRSHCVCLFPWSGCANYVFM